MKKKWIALVMASVMVMTFAGCGSSGKGAGEENAVQSTGQLPPEEKEESESPDDEPAEEITLRVSWWGGQYWLCGSISLWNHHRLYEK